MAELQPIIVFHGRHFIRHLGICDQICVKLLQLMCAVITRKSVKKTKSQYSLMAELQSIIVFHGRHFVCHLGICNRICVKLLKLMCAIITHNSVEKRSFYINKWLSYGQL